MNAVRRCSLALALMCGFSLTSDHVSAGGFTDFVKGHVRQQIYTPQQTPITKTIRVGKRAATAAATKTHEFMFDQAVKAGKKK